MAFDCEFTGLRSSGVREAWEDTPDERYCKLKRVNATSGMNNPVGLA